MGVTMPLAKDVFAILKKVRFPGLEQDIVSLGYVKDVALQGDELRISLDIKTSDKEAAAAIEAETRKHLNEAGYRYQIQVAHQGAQGPAGAPAGQVKIEDLLPEVKCKIAVASGKGGVGKSTVAVNLALALAEQGNRVGLLDADIYGPSLPTMLGVADREPVMAGGKVAPIPAHGILAMSLGFLTQGITPVIWRGPLASRAIEQLMSDVDWSGVEQLVLDLPPGTGDIQISISQKGNLTGAVIVTTPQDVALIDAIKGVRMFQKMNVPVLGIVENMSYFECPSCRKRSQIFPQGSLTLEMQRLGVPVLGRIPIDPDVAASGDSGRPLLVAAPTSTTASALRELASRVTDALAGAPRE